MATSIKISQLPAKGSNLEATDLLEVSEFNGTGYVSKSITGAEIVASIPPTSVEWGDIGGTLSAQTDLNTALNGKQDDITLTTTGTSGASTFVANTLNVPTYSLAGLGGVPTSRTLTINGTTQDLSADRTFTISTGITIGTTAITSGTVGRVLFEGTGNVVSESANLFWDNTNGRLGIGTSSPASKVDILQVADNTSPTLLRLNNTGSGASTGATLEFPFGAFIRSSYASMILSDRSGATVTLQGTSLTTTASSFSLAGAGIITFTGGSGTDGMIRTGGTITFNTFSGGYRDVGKFFQTGNFLIQTGGTFTDAGFKLDVNGTARVQGGTNGSLQFTGNYAQVLVGTNGFYISNNTGSVDFMRFLSDGRIGIGTNSPNASSTMEIASTTKGFLPPRMTTTQKNAIASPATGLMVYDTTLNLISVYNGTTWITL